ncbi:hypothetical protein KAT80_01650 [Candidatus Pacearchaeota archaeon]|nr:hypothetical protein [Candidatus Pacearchaeota archaeon]
MAFGCIENRIEFLQDYMTSLENISYYSHDLLQEIDRGEEILPQEWVSFNKTREIFAAIRYGAGDLSVIEDFPQLPLELDMTNSYSIFLKGKRSLEKIGLLVKTTEDVESLFKKFDRLFGEMADGRSLPSDTEQLKTYPKAKAFLRYFTEEFS